MDRSSDQPHVRSSSEPIGLDAVASEVARRLRHAADDRHDPMRLAVVATVGTDGAPRARTLVVRGATDDIDRLWFHTDVRASKVVELRRDPRLCAVVYDERDGVQITVQGVAALHTDGPVAEAHWLQVDLATQHLYQSERAPGAIQSEGIPETDPRTRAALRRLDLQIDDSRVRRNFAVIEMRIDSIDWLQTLASGVRRALLRRDTGWTAIEVGA